MSQLVPIYGGSGFVGRYIARRLAAEGWRVRVAVRRPNEAMHVKPYGVPGQVEPVFCNIRDDASVRAVMTGADAVVNCVGTFDRKGRNNFQAIQAEGATRIARIAVEEGVARMVHLSAIGADEGAASLYARTKELLLIQDFIRSHISGDIYVADGELPGGNSRIIVMNSEGQFLRQWSMFRTNSDQDITPLPHCLRLSNDGLVYVCDRQADRIQVFDRDGNFLRNIFLKKIGPYLFYSPVVGNKKLIITGLSF